MLARSLTLFLALMSSSASALADGVIPTEVVACQACHGVDGISISGDVPNLAGQRKYYLAQQLRAFKSGARKNDYMSVIAPQLDDARIEALADFWSRLPAGGDGAEKPSVASRQSPMQFPAKFPTGFTEYRRDDDVASGTISIFYANDVALAAARTGADLPHGAIVIGEFRKAKVDAAGAPLRDDKGRLLAGEVTHYSGMQTEAGWGNGIPDLLRNGDWRYALFDAAAKPNDKANYAVCLACHKPAVDKSYVLTWDDLVRQAKSQGAN